MFRESITRRQMLRTAAAGTAIGALGLPCIRVLGEETPNGLKITEPFHGAVLNHRHGKQAADSLTIRVAGEAGVDAKVTVNGVPARREGNRFEADVPLREHENEIVAVAEKEGGRQESRVRVVWDRYSEPRYRFGIDDNMFVFRDIAQKQYGSLFDCFYLKGLRDLNRKYGAKFVLNSYFVTTDDAKSPKPDDFTLAQFPDRYKGEFRDNSQWLKLAFHAYANMPSCPYQNATPEKLMSDMDRVEAELRRIAGEEAFSPTTCIHFATTRRSALKPLYARGSRVLTGSFYRHPNGQWVISYQLPGDVCAHCSTHEAWKDFDSGMVFSLCDIICNKVPVDQVAKTLEPLANDPNRAEIMDLFTHEQYFWPFYMDYIPDHFQRLETTIRWVTERGYKPVFFHEGFLGGRV